MQDVAHVVRLCRTCMVCALCEDITAQSCLQSSHVEFAWLCARGACVFHSMMLTQSSIAQENADYESCAQENAGHDRCADISFSH